MDKRKLAYEFYKVIRRSKNCPLDAYTIIEEEYEGDEFSYMCRLLNRWNEWQKLTKLGGRKYYNYFRILEKSV